MTDDYIVSLIVTGVVESFVLRLQEKMDRERTANPVDMDIVRFLYRFSVTLKSWARFSQSS